MQTQVHGVLFDIDGTLLDSNDAQAQAWIDAMDQHGYQVPFERVRSLIGKGGDRVLLETIGVEKESELGKQLSQQRKQIFLNRYLPAVQALPEAQALLQRLHDAGLQLVVATSAEPDELEALLHAVGPHADKLFAQHITSRDVKESKPSSDTVQRALQQCGCAPHEAIMIGDTPYDVQAATQAHVPVIAFRSGGWSDKDLHNAIAIYDGPADLLAHYAQSPLSRGVSAKML